MDVVGKSSLLDGQFDETKVAWSYLFLCKGRDWMSTQVNGVDRKFIRCRTLTLTVAIALRLSIDASSTSFAPRYTGTASSVGLVVRADLLKDALAGLVVAADRLHLSIVAIASTLVFFGRRWSLLSMSRERGSGAT